MEFTSDDYYPPDWSALPSHIYYFQIIKEGNLLGKIQVKDKQFSLIGRLEDLCDIYIDNPMVSRKHAILQAKQNDHCLYLMDLGSQHGTFVNKVRLPMKTYKKIQPFDSVKFGVSSRVYILRCPEFQQMKEQQQNERQNQFTKLLEEQHKKVSKSQLKAKYLDMLQNDPYFAANQAPRKLIGRQDVVQDQYEGIDWGITDQRQIYAYKNDNDLPIEPDLLRRLNLDSSQLTKLAEYEDHLRKYQEAEAQLNEITSKEKREYGLEEKLRSKKQKLQKRFVEALEAVEKCEDWLRVHIFGQVTENNKNMIIRQKQNDTFGDDVFLDRTLENKQIQVDKKDQVLESQSYWALEARFKAQLKQLNNLKQKLQMINTEKQAQNFNGKIQQQAEQEDELDLFMKQNKKETDQSNIQVLQRQMEIYLSSIQQIKSKLINIIGQQKVSQIINSVGSNNKVSFHQVFVQNIMEEHQQIAKKKLQQNRKIQDILNKIENNYQNEENVDEENIQIFKYYKQSNDKDQQFQLDQQQLLNKIRNQRDHYDPSNYEKPIYKMRKANDETIIKIKPQPFSAKDQFQQEMIDLTKPFK